MNNNEIQIHQVIENWAAAVRNNDINAILANHSDDMVMYDVPGLLFNLLVLTNTGRPGIFSLNTQGPAYSTSTSCI